MTALDKFLNLLPPDQAGSFRAAYEAYDKHIDGYCNGTDTERDRQKFDDAVYAMCEIFDLYIGMGRKS